MVIFFTEILIISALIQICFVLFFFKKLANYESNTKNVTTHEPLSILVCAKNDLDSLKQNIDSWLCQKIDQKQIMIVDDFSGIDTELFIRKLKSSKACLSYHKVKTNLPGKKQALKEGLSATRYNWTLLTDADCQATSDQWAAHMVSTAINQNKSIVLGYSPYAVNSNSWLQLWINFEGWLTGVLYLSFCLKGIPYMGVGRNLLYNKTTIPQSALSRFDNLVSGDDDLLINQISNAQNTGICIEKESFCYTEPSANWSAYIKQKLRHYTTATSYKLKHKLLLSLFSATLIGFYLSLIVLMFFNLKIAALTYLVYWLFAVPVFLKIMQKLKAKFNFIHLLIFHVLLSIYYTVFAFSFLFTPSRDW